MAERDPARHPNVSQNSGESGLMFLIAWCQGQLARLTLSPADYDAYFRIMRDHHDEEEYSVEFLRQMRDLLQDPDHAHLRVYYDVLYRDCTGEVQEADNLLILFPVALCGVLNHQTAICNALIGSLQNSPSRRDNALEVEQLREELRELQAIGTALSIIAMSVDRIGHPDVAATISRILELILRCLFRIE